LRSSKSHKPVRPHSFFAGAAASVAVAAVFFLSSPVARLAAAAATPPPTPPPIGAPPAPGTPGPAASVFTLPETTPSAAPSGKVKPTPSPPPNARKGLDGVWEVAIQRSNGTDYTHFAVRQQGDALNGTYLDAHGTKYPLAGTVEGQDVRLIVTMPNGTTLLLEGKLDGTTDMIGMLTTPDGQLPFTAGYRAKEKWIENVNPSPGGISQPGGYTPP
jgi:hypothetical protein